MKAIQTKVIHATDIKPTRIKACAEGVLPITYSKNALEDECIRQGLRSNIEDCHALAARQLCNVHDWRGDLASGFLPDGDGAHCFIPKEPEPTLEQSTLPTTDSEKIALYLDWFNNYISLPHFARCNRLDEQAARRLIAEGRKLHEASCKPTLYTVVTVSTNTNSFGYKSCLCLAENGEGLELLVQAYGTDKVPVRGDKVDPKEPRFFGAPRSLPKITPERALKILKEI